jgi:hypothetical protein
MGYSLGAKALVFDTNNKGSSPFIPNLGNKIKNKIKTYNVNFILIMRGSILKISDGIARVHGLPNTSSIILVTKLAVLLRVNCFLWANDCFAECRASYDNNDWQLQTL